jgi:hypothetical protein
MGDADGDAITFTHAGIRSRRGHRAGPFVAADGGIVRLTGLISVQIRPAYAATGNLDDGFARRRERVRKLPEFDALATCNQSNLHRLCCPEKNRTQ